MREIPILFSGPMIRAILTGRKTQTRRALKPQPQEDIGLHLAERPLRWAPGDRLWVRETLTVNGDGLEYAADGEICHNLFDADTNAEAATELWNRRAHIDGPDLHPMAVPSIYMPRWACRITLDVTDVRVERLQVISEADALAEGARTEMNNWTHDVDSFWFKTARLSFQHLWDTINGPSSWDANPWVAVITFQRVLAGSAING